jgi:hypothetical protein
MPRKRFERQRQSGWDKEDRRNGRHPGVVRVPHNLMGRKGMDALRASLTLDRESTSVQRRSFCAMNVLRSSRRVDFRSCSPTEYMNRAEAPIRGASGASD